MANLVVPETTWGVRSFGLVPAGRGAGAVHNVRGASGEVHMP
jgi:hypothetical protein